MPSLNRGQPKRIRLATLVLVLELVVVAVLIRDPLYTVLAFGGVGIIIGAVVVVVGRFRRYAVDRTPHRFTESSSTTVRVATRAASTYATYLVAFYTVIAVLLLFGVVGHFL